MAGEPNTIVTPATRDVALPGENVIVTPATREEPLPDEVPAGEDRSISFQDQEYTFPSTATDDQIFEFLRQIPAPKVEEEEVKEPLRERKVIKKDEGVKKNKEGEHISYRDTVRSTEFPKGILTGGRGHVLTDDEAKLYPKGTAIPDALVESWFDVDMKEADDNLIEILEEKAVHVSDDVYDILLNMTFNLGKGKVPTAKKKGKGILGFKNMWAAIQLGRWDTASVEMRKSKWFGQVKDRGIRLVDRMAAIPLVKEPAAPAITAE